MYELSHNADDWVHGSEKSTEDNIELENDTLETVHQDEDDFDEVLHETILESDCVSYNDDSDIDCH